MPGHVLAARLIVNPHPPNTHHVLRSQTTAANVDPNLQIGLISHVCRILQLDRLLILAAKIQTQTLALL